MRPTIRYFSTPTADPKGLPVANLEAAIDLYMAHYNFCRMHGSLPGTPAMAAGIAGHPWTLAELLDRLEE
jgi:hypothetical protein